MPDIMIKPDALSSGTLRKTISAVKKAYDAAAKAEKEGSYYHSWTWGGVTHYLFTNESYGNVIGAANLLKDALDRLEELSRIMQSGPDGFKDIDRSFKISIRSWRRSGKHDSVLWTASGGSGTAEETEINQNNYTDAHSVDVEIDAQDTPYYCAYASAAMLLQAAGVDCSEEKLVEMTGGDNNLFTVHQAMNLVSNNRFEEKPCERSEAALDKEIVNSIDKGIPVQINVFLPTKEPFGYTATQGHYVVITGIYTNEKGERMVQINDPFSPDYMDHGIKSGQKIEMPLSSLYNVWGHEFLIVAAEE